MPTRLVLYFHGWYGDESEIIGDRNVKRTADTYNAIIVTPRGLGQETGDPNSWRFYGSDTGLDGDGVNPAVAGDTAKICDEANTGGYSTASCGGVAQNTCSWTHCKADDADFVVALVDYLSDNLCIDLDNVFASGGSNGGMFTWFLGQNSQTAPIFRAIAPIIGLPHRAFVSTKGKDAEMPVLLITGTRDATVPPGGWEDETYTTTSDGDAFYYTSATAITKAWANDLGCDTSTAASYFDTGYSKADCRSYCVNDVTAFPRVLDCRANMGHTYSLQWTWYLVMDFFEAHATPSVTLPPVITGPPPPITTLPPATNCGSYSKKKACPSDCSWSYGTCVNN